jgi:hypothetical protein
MCRHAHWVRATADVGTFLIKRNFNLCKFLRSRIRMWLQVLVPIVLVAVCQMVSVPSSKLRYDYCVIGAGPAGLQMGYFLKGAGRDYVILERSHQAGEIWAKKTFGVLFWWNEFAIVMLPILESFDFFLIMSRAQRNCRLTFFSKFKICIFKQL